MSADYYGLRRPSPYLGVIQVVDVGDACAYSVDGRRWQIRGVNTTRRFWPPGEWQENEPPRQEDAPGDIVEALRHRPRPPFPLRDRYELWLLHKTTRLPLALLKTRRRARDLEAVSDPTWHSFVPEENGFTPGPVADVGSPPATRPLRRRDVLERQVNLAARPFPSAQWFQRHEDGSGTGGFGLRVNGDLVGRRLPCEAFPELLVDEHWDTRAECQLIMEYHDWHAPLLLVHQDLSQETRRRLERAAGRRPEKLLEVYSMLPRVMDREAMTVAMVSARLMRAL
ncbi:MAG: hypothetical protein KGJ12_00015 [Gammaproteobacteria bacterium]|nr:hypothetical protein [Gammaproteobacteria bacterium]